MTEETIYHTPVMLAESIDKMQVEGDTLCADLTFGGGGHSCEILRRLSPEGRLISFDRDSDAIANKPDDDRLTLIRSDFRWIHNHIIHQGYKDGIDGVLFLLNTMGGDVEAGLALAELVASMQKPTVSLVLGGGHSIGVPLATAADHSLIVPSATMTLHPVRMNGLVIGVPQTFATFAKINAWRNAYMGFLQYVKGKL